MNFQRGFITFEFAIVTTLFALLLTAAIPKTGDLIDKITLDYETKKLYSELRFLQAMDRTATIENTGMKDLSGEIINKRSEVAKLEISSTNNSYQIKRGTIGIRKCYYLSNGIKIFSPETSITFDRFGNCKELKTSTITLISRTGDKRKIIFDSVGRFRSGYGNDS